MSHEHDPAPNPTTRNPLLAATLGFLFLGLGFFYAMPLRKAILPAIVSIALVVVSAGILLVPVMFGCAFACAYAVRVDDGQFGFAGFSRAGYDTGKSSDLPVAPGMYQSVHKAMRNKRG